MVRPIAVDLFCGAGGMSLGFEQAGFNVAVAVDNDPINVATHCINFPNCTTIHADLTTLTGADLRKQGNLVGRDIDVLFGGPPCQGFSEIGHQSLADPRNQLIHHFARLIKELSPRYFVVENVRGLLFTKWRNLVTSFVESATRAGYNVIDPISVLKAQSFGVPQRRERVFIVGYRIGVVAPTIPVPKSTATTPTVWDAISDLSQLSHTTDLFECDTYLGELGEPSSYARLLRGIELDPNDRFPTSRTANLGLTGCALTRHSQASIKRFESTLPGTYEAITHYYRLEKSGLAPTLRAGTGPDKGSFTAARPIHPVAPRCITVREAARLHSFPDWIHFHPTRWHGFRQVGNSVPPLLARSVADSIYSARNRRD